MNIPAEQRICRLCKLDVENEIHFLLECPSLANIGGRFWIKLNLGFLASLTLNIWTLKANLSGFFQQMITTFIIRYTLY